MAKYFNEQVMKLRPNWRVVSDYFYVTPVDHVLCGFVYEKGSNWNYIWRYALPLYDRLDYLHLNFGERLRSTEGWLRVKCEAAKEEPSLFVRAIESFEEETYEWQNLSGFLYRLKQLIPSKNLKLHKAHVTTLVMLNRLEEAQAELQSVLLSPNVREYPTLVEDLSLLSMEISRGSQPAQQLLLRWEAETKKSFGIDTVH